VHRTVHGFWLVSNEDTLTLTGSTQQEDQGRGKDDARTMHKTVSQGDRFCSGEDTAIRRGFLSLGQETGSVLATREDTAIRRGFWVSGSVRADQRWDGAQDDVQGLDECLTKTR
jgi:hypothetical protein